MGIILVIIILLYLIFAITVFVFVVKKAKKKSTVWVVGVLLVLFPFKHWLFYGVLFGIYDLWPLQKIHERVDYPHSVYWEDNVWPGYDEYGRSWMVENYLDGIHLQKLALNGDDGKIYLYTADEDSRAGSRNIKNRKEVLETEEELKRVWARRREIHERTGNWDKELWVEIEQKKERLRNLMEGYGTTKKKEVKKIIARGEIYVSSSHLPPMNYHVKLEPIHRFFPATKLYHADLLTIADNRTEEVIAYSKRFMAYAPLMIALHSGTITNFGMRKGNIQVYEFDDKVLFGDVDTNRGYDIERKRKLNQRL